MHKDKRITFFFTKFDKQTNWTSTNKILNSILQEKHQLRLYFNLFDIDNLPENINLKSRNHNSQIHIFIYSPFLDQPAFKNIRDLFKEFKNTIFYLPIFGNLIASYNRWTDILNIFTGLNTHLLCASEAAISQAKALIELNIPIHLVKYPIENVYINQDYTKKDTKTINFLYAGRITHSKGIIETILAFQNSLKEKSNIRLTICGYFSDWALPAHKVFQSEESLKRDLFDLIKDYSDSIILKGNLNSEEFSEELRKSHCLISPSHFHDEDFGTTVAQALCTYTDCILSDWGGYKDFIKEFDLKHFKVRRDCITPHIKLKDIYDSIISYQYNEEAQLKKSKFAKELLSAKNFISSLRNITLERQTIYSLPPLKNLNWNKVSFLSENIGFTFKDEQIYLKVYEGFYSNEHNSQYFSLDIDNLKNLVKNNSSYLVTENNKICPFFITRIIQKKCGGIVPNKYLRKFSTSFFKNDQFLFNFYKPVAPYLLLEPSYSCQKSAITLSFLGDDKYKYFMVNDYADFNDNYIYSIKNEDPQPLNLTIKSNKFKTNHHVTILPNNTLLYPKDFSILNQSIQVSKIRIQSFHSFKQSKVFNLLKKIDFTSLLDLGCGKGVFLSKCKAYFTQQRLYGYDKVDYSNEIHKIGLEYLKDFKEINSKLDVLTLIEVIEHIPTEEHEEIIKIILNNYSPNNILISTPLAGPLGLSDKDHKFEWTELEFKEWISKYFSKTYEISHYEAFKHPQIQKFGQIIHLSKII